MTKIEEWMDMFQKAVENGPLKPINKELNLQWIEFYKSSHLPEE